MHQPEISKDAVRNANHVEKICRAYSCSNETTPQMHGSHCIWLHCIGCTACGCTAWGCTACGYTAWGCTAWICTAWGCTTWGSTAWDCTAWGCTTWSCIAWAALYKLYVFFCLGGEAIPLSLGRACLIKPQFIITVINADCRITKS